MAAPVLLVAATACAGQSRRALPVVPVTERDFAIHIARVVPRGEVRIVVTNKGPVDHELLIVHATDGKLPLRSDGFTIDEDAIKAQLVGSLEASGPGTRSLVANLEPGRYIVFCNMAGHAAAGMETSFAVR